ncbi:hypothetical protein WME75_09505 [Sorangium sp. So ce1014]|uniref:hypothetical protein n=1 Tax=Sorangium sp. So ce1014 TaxID=3133326 RepID=UPI003F607C2D
MSKKDGQWVLNLSGTYKFKLNGLPTTPGKKIIVRAKDDKGFSHPSIELDVQPAVPRAL